MNIVLYVNSFIPRLGGKEIVVHYLARELHRMGHAVRVVGPSGWIKRRNLRSEYPVHCWPTLRGLFPEKVAYAQLRLDTAIWKCDVVHAHTTFPNGYVTALLKRKRRLPLVITPHGYDIHVIPELGFGHRLDPEKNAKIAFALERAEIATAISGSVAASLRDAGCSASKIRKIPNGIDLERFHLIYKPDVRQRLGLAHDTQLILSVGNCQPRKGQDVIIAAMPQVISRIPNARLVIVGSNQHGLQKQVQNLKLEAYVRLTGPIPFPLPLTNGNAGKPQNEEDFLAALYCQSNAYVSASISKEAEGLSLAMLDAMAAGMPVAATRISGSSDIVAHGKTGLLFPPANPRELADALIALLEDKNRATAMGRQGQLIAKDYHWREIARQYLSVYREAAEIAANG